MYKHKNLLIALSSITVLVVILFSAYLFNKNKSSQIATNPQPSQKGETNLKENINNAVGGYIQNDGFEITYNYSDQRFVITITKNPFENYKNSAYKWLGEQGIDTSKTRIICMISEGVNATEEQLNKCDR